jgi:hypothetical protein
MRIILFNGSTVLNYTSPAAACYTSLVSRYACSSDTVDFSSSKASGLIHSGEASLFSSICNDEVAGQYRFNLTAVGPSQAILPFTNAACTDIGNKTGIIERQGIPSGSLGAVEALGQTRLQLSLAYEKIKIEGVGRLGRGTHRLCIEKIGGTSLSAIVNITSC